jgi:hypothetical protein
LAITARECVMWGCEGMGQAAADEFFAALDPLTEDRPAVGLKPHRLDPDPVQIQQALNAVLRRTGDDRQFDGIRHPEPTVCTCERRSPTPHAATKPNQTREINPAGRPEPPTIIHGAS